MAAARYSVVIARFPGNHQEHPASSQWVIDTVRGAQTDPRISKIGTLWKSDTPITMVRNLVVKTCLQEQVDYLLMIDSDMSPDLPIAGAKPFWGSSWEFLMDRREREEEERRLFGKDFAGATAAYYAPATVAAPYCGPPPDECVFMFDWQSREGNTPSPSWKLGMVDRRDAAIRVGIQPAAAMATGLILYDMRVFAELAKPWFAYEWEDSEQSTKATTEDVYQTRNASLIGMPQFCNWDAWAGHVKLKTVGKPSVITVDMVRKDLRDAVTRGIRTGDKSIYVQPPAPQAQSDHQSDC